MHLHTLHHRKVQNVHSALVQTSGAIAPLKKYLRAYGYIHSPASDETDYLHCRYTVVTRYYIQYQANNTFYCPTIAYHVGLIAILGWPQGIMTNV